jgi:hypothetical protein
MLYCFVYNFRAIIRPRSNGTCSVINSVDYMSLDMFSSMVSVRYIACTIALRIPGPTSFTHPLAESIAARSPLSSVFRLIR